MTTLRRLVFVCFALGCTARVAADEAPATPAPSAAAASTEAAQEPQARPVAAVQPSPEPQFVIAPLHDPARWQLVLAGLAAAVWVAHRRLRYWY